MIEVEKKFRLLSGDEDRLLQGAVFIKEIELRDTYYDAADRSLSLHDTWLRERNGGWELKMPLNTAGSDQRVIDQYRELDDEQAIATAIGLPGTGPLLPRLTTAGYSVIAPLVTIRRKYRRDPFVIDIDRLDFGYELAEIELLVADESHMEEATKKILHFAETCQLKTIPVRGKVIEYLARFSPTHLDQLRAAGVV